MIEKKLEELTIAVSEGTDSTNELISVIKDLLAGLESGELKLKTPSTSTKAKKAGRETDNVETLKPKKTASKKEPKEQTADQPSKDDVREALLGYMKRTSKAQMHDLLDDVADGAANINQIDEAYYAAIIETCNANKELDKAA